jgi:hypothetical protein
MKNGVSSSHCREQREANPLDATWRLAVLTLVMALIALGIYAFQEQQDETKAVSIENRYLLQRQAAKRSSPVTTKPPLSVDVLPVEGAPRPKVDGAKENRSPLTGITSTSMKPIVTQERASEEEVLVVTEHMLYEFPKMYEHRRVYLVGWESASILTVKPGQSITQGSQSFPNCYNSIFLWLRF